MFYPYVIAVPHRQLAYIFADAAHQQGGGELITEDDQATLNDLSHYVEIASEADEELEFRKGVSHQITRKRELINQQRINRGANPLEY